MEIFVKVISLYFDDVFEIYSKILLESTELIRKYDKMSEKFPLQKIISLPCL